MEKKQINRQTYFTNAISLPVRTNAYELNAKRMTIIR